MENCLLIKLKGTVPNAEIMKLGEARIVTAEPNSGTSLFSSNVAQTLKIISGTGTFKNPAATDAGKTLVIPANTDTDISTTAAGDVISIENKYAITGFTLGSTSQGLNIDISALKFSLLKNLLSNTASTIIGDIAALKDKPLRRVNLASQSGIIGKIAEIAGIASLYDLRINATQIEGDVNVLSTLTGLSGTVALQNTKISGNIATLILPNAVTTLFLHYDSGVVGQLEDFLDNCHNNGRISGTLTINVRNTGVTFNGQPLTAAITATFTESGWNVA